MLSIFRFVDNFRGAWKINPNYWMNLIAFDTFFRMVGRRLRDWEMKSNLYEAHCFWSLENDMELPITYVNCRGSSITLSCAMHYSRQRLKITFQIKSYLFGELFQVDYMFSVCRAVEKGNLTQRNQLQKLFIAPCAQFFIQWLLAVSSKNNQQPPECTR